MTIACIFVYVCIEKTRLFISKVEELSAAVERDKVTQKETAAKARELEAKVKDIKGHRER